MTESQKTALKIRATKVRMNIIEGTFNAKSGHPGGSLSMADVLTYIYSIMNIDPKNPKKEDRDRFVLSKGHAAPGLYGILAEHGFFDKEEIKKLRKTDAMLQGHPDMKGTPGVDMSTGSLGQGISAAAGMALSAKLYNKDYKVYTVLGDGEIQEGQVWEAAMFAAHRKLDNLIAVVDNNNLQIDGAIDEINSPYPIKEKFEAFGWHVIEICAHCFTEIEDAFNEAKEIKGKPVCILQKSVKGKGVSFMENKCEWHGSAPNKEQYDIAMAELTAKLTELGGTI